MTARGAGQTGARGLISGTVSNGSSWFEDLEITEDGAAVVNADLWEWRLTFRNSYEDDIDLTLSTTDAKLAIVQGADATVLQIRVAHTAISDMDGDYVCDLASKDSTVSPARMVHWASGVVTFRNEPIGW